jgi:hypothetical protein
MRAILVAAAIAGLASAAAQAQGHRPLSSGDRRGHTSRNLSIVLTLGTIAAGAQLSRTGSPPTKKGDEAQLLPPLRNGETAQLHDPKIEDKETRPPPRYNEGTPIEAMQNASCCSRVTLLQWLGQANQSCHPLIQYSRAARRPPARFCLPM